MQPVQKGFEDHRLIAVIHSSSAQDAEEMIKAAAEGGIKMFEISINVPQSPRILESYSKKEGFLFGAGAVTDGEVAQRAINAGAAFISSHYTDQEIINVAKHNDVFVIQGVSTTTEAFEAYRYGADCVKFFPAGPIGGPEHLHHIHGALPFLKLTAEEGIDLENLFDYLKHCLAVFVRRALFDKALVRQNNWAEITERAKKFTQKVESLKVVK